MANDKSVLGGLQRIAQLRGEAEMLRQRGTQELIPDPTDVSSYIDKIIERKGKGELEQLEMTEAAQELLPTPAQAAWHGAQVPFPMGLLDILGKAPGPPSDEVPLLEWDMPGPRQERVPFGRLRIPLPHSQILDAPPMPSLRENIREGDYWPAAGQLLGGLGDLLQMTPFLAALGAGIKIVRGGAELAGQAVKSVKGIATLAETRRMLKADVDEFAKDDMGFVSPTLKALILKAPPNLKGKGLTEWLRGNAGEGIKPKEMEFLGIYDFIARNPNAIVREVVEGVSGNKVKVTKEILRDESLDIEWEITIPTSHPLSGNPLHQGFMNSYYTGIGVKADTYAKRHLLEHYNDVWIKKPALIKAAEKLGRLPAKVESFDDIPQTMHDELIEDLSRTRYNRNPYEKVGPVDLVESKGIFALGNDSEGYHLFSDGREVTDFDNIPYSRNEAQIRLLNIIDRDAPDYYGVMEEENQIMTAAGTRDRPAQFKSFIDANLPGGKNYREVVFEWANAPVKHDIGHFTGRAIANALVRDRKLADGSPTTHVDELQSKLHTVGSREGYQLSEAGKLKAIDEVEKILEDTPFSYGEGRRKTQDFSLRGINIPADIATELGYVAGRPRHLSFDDLIDMNEEGLGFSAQQVGYVEGQNITYLDFLEAKEPNAVPAWEQTGQYYDSIPALENIRLLSKGELAGDAFRLMDDLGPDKTRKLLKIINPLTRWHDTAVAPNYPFKDDWYEMGLKNLLRDNIYEGKDTLSVSGSAAITARYAERYKKYYESLYDKKIPSAMKKLANKYGGKFERGSLDLVDTYGSRNLRGSEVQVNIIRITPEMKEKILAEGFQSFGLAKGGLVNSKIEMPNNYREGGRVRLI